jgi:TIR domain
VTDRVDVFISYASEPEDSEKARALGELVEAAGLRPWIDTKLRPSPDVHEEIFSRIDRAPVMLFLVSPTSVRDEASYTRDELKYALDRRRYVITCRVAPAKLPHGLEGRLCNLPSLDVSIGSPADWAPDVYDALEAAGLPVRRPSGSERRSAGALLPLAVKPRYRELRTAPPASVQTYLDRYAGALRSDTGYYGWGHLNLGLLLLFLKQRDTAVEHLTEASRKLASNARAQYFAALALAAGKALRYRRSAEISAIEASIGAARALDPADGLPDLLDAVVLAEHYGPNGIRRPGAPNAAALVRTAWSKRPETDELQRLADTLVITDRRFIEILRATG